MTWKKGTPISENSPCPFLKAYIEAKRILLSVSSEGKIPNVTKKIADNVCFFELNYRFSK